MKGDLDLLFHKAKAAATSSKGVKEEWAAPMQRMPVEATKSIASSTHEAPLLRGDGWEGQRRDDHYHLTATRAANDVLGTS